MSAQASTARSNVGISQQRGRRNVRVLRVGDEGVGVGERSLGRFECPMPGLRAGKSECADEGNMVVGKQGRVR